MRDPITLTVLRKMPSDPPTGDLTRAVMVKRDNGGWMIVVAASLANANPRLEPEWWGETWWSELPVPPGADPLTTNHLQLIHMLATDGAVFGRPYMTGEDRADAKEVLARLRRALDGMEEP